MAVSATPFVPEQSATTTQQPILDISKPPVIDGFTPLSRPREETFQEKFMRKSKENPFVPIGCLGTAGALMYGLRAFKQGKTRQSQLLMRGRIFAQGFTVVAIIFGVFATALKKDWAALGLCSFTAKLFATGKNKNKKFLIRQVQIVPLCCCGGEWNVLKDLTEQIFKSPPPPPKKGSPFSGLP